MQTIYADVLIVLNVYVNFFLLRITSRLTHSPLRGWRCILAAFYGSLYSLMILLPQLPEIVNFLIKSAAAVTIVICAFGIQSRRRLLINTGTFFAVNFLLAGCIYGVYTWLRPAGMHFSNGSFYIDFSLTVLVITTAVFYGIVRIGLMLTRNCADDSYRVVIRYNDRVTSIDGLADTGNKLIDYFTGTPVVICGEDKFRELTGFGGDISQLPRGFRLLACTTVSAEGVIPVFRPDEVLIISRVTGERRAVDVMIGQGRSGGKAIFDPVILKN